VVRPRTCKSGYHNKPAGCGAAEAYVSGPCSEEEEEEEGGGGEEEEEEEEEGEGEEEEEEEEEEENVEEEEEEEEHNNTYQPQLSGYRQTVKRLVQFFDRI
jgi:hypothetical protein